MNSGRAKQYIFPAVIFIFAILNGAYAQKTPICDQCGKSITGNYIDAGGKKFHPEHFLCARCGKKIGEGYQSDNGKYFHNDCYLLNEGLICDYCEQVLDGEYAVSRGKKYHQECYEKFILLKCSICGLPIRDAYLIDPYKNQYHSNHKKELDKCDCCGRLICDALTGGGRIYSDGRHICNLCLSTAVTESGKIAELLSKVIDRLESLGIPLDEKRINIKGIDRNGLRSRVEHFSEETRGVCDSRTRTEYENGRVVKETITHTIYVLTGMPATLTESTIAHELMHVWIYDNTENGQQDWILEGSCNYISYLYLKSLPQKEASDFIIMLENDRSPVYGKGFLEIRSKFQRRVISELLIFLKK